MAWFEDSWLAALSGGALIGLAASLLLAINGRIAGVSGIVSGLLSPQRGDRSWRWLFVLGLCAAGLVALALRPSSLVESPAGVVALGVAGLLVGAGTRLSGGCTSGHGVCGVSRLSLRSIVATTSFVASGMLTVALFRWLRGEP